MKQKSNQQQRDRGINSTKDEDTEEGSGMNQELQELFLSELADILSAETQLTKALPKLAEAATSPALAEAFRDHLEETKEHVSRLNSVFESLDEKPRSKECKAMKGLVAEGQEILNEHKDSSVLDAALIAAAQKVEHYEIASYGTVLAWAKQMGHSEAADLLESTLEEEKAADEKLTEIAESDANEPAD